MKNGDAINVNKRYRITCPYCGKTQYACLSIAHTEWIDVLAINEDGNIVSIADEAWTFQFIPIVEKMKY